MSKDKAEESAYVLVKAWCKQLEESPPGIVGQGILSPTLTVLSDMCAQAIREAEKRRGAEVLAACIKELERLSEEARGFGFDDDSLVISNAKDKVKELQPAASDLEALLREAELKGRLCVLRENPGLCNGDTDNPERHSRLCKYHQEISELEKARAEGKS